ncbi:Pr6Pr family membrane protein [Nocardioides hwasunensis]|uniref:Pr6Pr family membrane protein n=1 Tax=Nocardioides hwasunensis TaxID=397258 RepID=A0ABR8MK74_9ACTN|nr:Pr6Pr family membrane protein [Nocardioides hwasunensis]MBD3916437.1 Pr6Pr family membrane protein [Nocardioides hwasunensis]
MSPARARTVHLVVAVLAWGAVLFQLVLVLRGSDVLLEDDPPGMGERIYRFFAYFTIQSNLLVAIPSTVLARDPLADRPWWRVARLAGLVGITVTGLVHFFLLRPLLHLDGADWLADKWLHMVVPVVAVAAWAWVGPRPRASVRDAAYAIVWPIAWTAWTLVFAEIDGWVPYPFMDADKDGWGPVLVACGGITLLFVGFFALYVWLDRTLSPTPPSAEA